MLCALSHEHPPPPSFVPWHKCRFLSRSLNRTEALQLSFPPKRDGKTISVSGEIIVGEATARRVKNYVNNGISLKSADKKLCAAIGILKSRKLSGSSDPDCLGSEHTTSPNPMQIRGR